MTPRPDGAPGDRVVVRFAKGEGAPGDWRRDPSATRTDVTGVLVSVDDENIVVERDGEDVAIPGGLVLSMRVLPDHAIRTSDIRELETAAARGWPGIEQTEIEGWLLRAGGGYSRRANSALPLRFGSRADAATIDAIRRWYTDRDLPARIADVDRLLAPGTVPDGTPEIRAVVMTRGTGPIGAGSAIDVVVADAPSDDWLAAVIGHRTGQFDASAAADVLRAVRDGVAMFASVHVDGTLVATGRGAITASSADAPAWLGVACLWTDPDHRNRSIGGAVIDALLRGAREAGCGRAYLQVEHDNLGAIRLYRRLGFARHHAYRYLTI
ncbi:GNAT family N-acetyltransferase [Williamsia sp. SKLECPSW1]